MIRLTEGAHRIVADEPRYVTTDVAETMAALLSAHTEALATVARIEDEGMRMGFASEALRQISEAVAAKPAPGVPVHR